MEYIINQTEYQPNPPTSSVTTTEMAVLFVICTIVLAMMSWEDRRNLKRRNNE